MTATDSWHSGEEVLDILGGLHSWSEGWATELGMGTTDTT
jgi:hypothetical protein